ncbi:MAG: alpha/beta fold hydrolase [Pseudomonadota bacterium]
MKPHHFTTTDGLKLAYYVDDNTDPWADAPTLLMLHAAMGCAERFYGWVAPLSRHYRVVRLDLRGHGNSQTPAPDSRFDMDRLVADTLELMDLLGCKSAHVVGNSAGGYIGQNLAMDHPERVRSLILFGSTPGLRNSQAKTWIPRIAKDGIRKFLLDTIEDRFVPGTDPRKIEWFVSRAAQCDPAYIGRFVGLMSSLDWSERLGEIKCPTLLVIPGAETVGSISNYDVMRQRIPDVQLIAYEGLPHNIGEAAPERCAEDVLAFLRWRFGMPSPALHIAHPH